jgi:ornithine cyclodeaminase/alanine dehydrogenase-like protein (mu-crystallin family)
VKATAVASPEQAVRDSEIIVSATTSTTPVVLGQYLAPGVHINAIGANYEFRRELDRDAVLAANFIATDDREQVQYESMDLAEPVKEGALKWESVFNLADVVCGQVKGRSSPKDITIFKSLGVAIEDVALAIRAYEKALTRKVGQALPDLTG